MMPPPEDHGLRLTNKTLKTLQSIEKSSSNTSAKELYESIEKPLRSHHRTLLEAFRQWAPEIDQVPKFKPFGEPQRVHVVAMVTALVVGERAGKSGLPPWFLPYLQLVPYLEIYDCFPPCQRACALLPPAMLREAILGAQERWSNTYAIALLSCIPEDAETITDVVGKLSVGERQTEDISFKLHTIGAPLLPAIEAVWADDLWKYHAIALLMALHRLKLPSSAALYVRALGHRSKPVRAFAQTGLADLGGSARAALEAGVKARKKAVRVFCSDQLALLGPAGDGEDATEAPAASGFQGLPPEEQTRMLERIDAVREQEKLRPALFKQMNDAPALWFEAMVIVLGNSVGRDDIQHLIAATLRRPAFSAHLPTFWGVYLRFLSRHNISDSYNHWQLMKHIATIPQDLDPGIYERAYLGAAGPFTTKLLPHYFTHVRPPSPALMV